MDAETTLVDLYLDGDIPGFWLVDVEVQPFMPLRGSLGARVKIPPGSWRSCSGTSVARLRFLPHATTPKRWVVDHGEWCASRSSHFQARGDLQTFGCAQQGGGL
jgi:hypothetical protein